MKKTTATTWNVDNVQSERKAANVECSQKVFSMKGMMNGENKHQKGDIFRELQRLCAI